MKPETRETVRSWGLENEFSAYDIGWGTMLIVRILNEPELIRESVQHSFWPTSQKLKGVALRDSPGSYGFATLVGLDRLANEFDNGLALLPRSTGTFELQVTLQLLLGELTAAIPKVRNLLSIDDGKAANVAIAALTEMQSSVGQALAKCAAVVRAESSHGMYKNHRLVNAPTACDEPSDDEVDLIRQAIKDTGVDAKIAVVAQKVKSLNDGRGIRRQKIVNGLRRLKSEE